MFGVEIDLIGFVQLVAAAASAPAQDQEAQQASAQELQGLKESLNQSENRTRELEGHLENLNRVSALPCLKGLWQFQFSFPWGLLSLNIKCFNK